MRRLKPISDLLRDPEFPLRAVRLMGAAEMVSLDLQMSDDEKLQAKGVRLEQINDWFFEKEEMK